MPEKKNRPTGFRVYLDNHAESRLVQIETLLRDKVFKIERTRIVRALLQVLFDAERNLQSELMSNQQVRHWKKPPNESAQILSFEKQLKQVFLSAIRSDGAGPPEQADAATEL